MERETLQEIRRKTTKNLLWSLAESEREREKVLKKWFEQVKFEFFKNLILDVWLIETTVLIDQNRQRLHQNFKHNFYWTKDRLDQLKFWKNRIFFLKNKSVFEKNSSKHWILGIKYMSMRWNVFPKHKFWTQFSQN